MWEMALKTRGYLMETDSPCTAPQLGALGRAFRAGTLMEAEAKLFHEHTLGCARCSIDARNARILAELRLQPEDVARAAELGLRIVRVSAQACTNTREIAARIRSFGK
jgi:hypothetical protein